MEVLSIQQHARDTLRLAGMMWAAGLFWAASELDYSGGGGLHRSRAAWESRAGVGTAQKRGQGWQHRGGSGGWWQDRDWEVLHRGWTEEAGGCVVSGLRLDRGESGLHRGEAGDWAK
ncbi:hypothetical protein Acr_11g0005180 [Actinidia rufa]|uniref:Uncharacterized protein n=1 Tax=Actinidia rufa TaxID=165716 RepID=A0A7J0FBY5_9ERIC|nr:hypothetical protein Acr_11g0005180 [Actinidia rufa]